MKIRLFSDLHLEFSDHKWNHLWTKSDEDKDTICILAGDIDVGTMAQEFMTDLCSSFKYVIRTCGNHEFYNQDYFTVIDGWRKYEKDGPENFHFLYNDMRVIDGYRIIGGTMWTSFDNESFATMLRAENSMNDYRCIMNGGLTIRPRFIYNEHIKFMEFYQSEMAKPFDGKTIVVTHHSPCDSVRIKGIPDPLYFASIEKDMVDKKDLALWVHGHVHSSWDHMVGDTRVVCNPYGYYNYATNDTFNKDLIIEV